MKKTTRLNTFVLMNGSTIISPELVTIREYGRWLQEVYDEYVCNYELYLRAKDSGETVLQYHPGTKIGNYFDKSDFMDSKYYSWFILKENQVLQKLKKLGLAEMKDTISSAVNDKQHRQMLRVYTVDQIELYVRTHIERDFNISKYITQEPYQVKLGKNWENTVIMPEVKKAKSTLFDINTPIEMTMEQVEKALGHKVSIISKEG